MVTITLTTTSTTLTQIVVSDAIGSNTNVDAVIPSNVTTIDASAFADVTSKITSITIPSNVISIGESAFNGCSLVTNIIEQLTLTNLGTGAFNGCPITITILDLKGSTQTVLGNNTFNDSNLQNILLPKTIAEIGTNCFNTVVQMTSIKFHEDTAAIDNTDILSQIKATDIYLNPSILRANAVTGNIWATGNYYLYLSPRVRFGPTGVILPDGSKIPTTITGTMLRGKTVESTTTYAVLPFKQSFPETYNGYVDIPSVSNNITVHPGFNIICTKSGTGDPNNNSNASIIIPSDAVSATGWFAPYLDNTNGSTNLTGTIASSYPSILLFYNDTLVRTMPSSA